MSTALKTFIVLFICLGGFCISAESAVNSAKNVGLSVEPGWMLICNVPVGKLYDVDGEIATRFRVHNGSDLSRRYGIKADKPEKVGVKVLKGYDGIPDPAWFWFEKTEILAPANGLREIKMFVRIPNEEKYFNQKWAVGIDVEGKAREGEGLVLALSPVFYIETEARADVKEKPAGLLGIAPGTIVLDNVVLGMSKSVSKIMVYNNDSRAHTYKVSSIVPSAQAGCQVIGTSPGFSWIPAKDWLKPDCSAIKIGPKEMKAITLDLDIPQMAELRNKRWEGTIFVESEDGLADFARVQIRNAGR